ncbi:MAG: ABC transporter ATP-binding protein [Streptomyces sp.]|nr:ABC transporter ATP-binding protein [Streptomyces sp.]
MRDRRLLLGTLRAAPRTVVSALVCLRLLAGALPAAVAYTVAALVDRIDAAPAADALRVAAAPLAVFGAALLLGHAADCAIAPLEFVTKGWIDGAHRAEVARITASSRTIGVLEQPRAQRLIRNARADPRSWTERTPGDGAVDQIKLVSVLFGVAAACAVLVPHGWWLAPLLAVPALLNAAVRSRRQEAFTRFWVSQADHGLHARVWEEATVSAGEAKDMRVFGLGEWVVQRISLHVRAMFEPVWAAQAKYARRQWLPLLLVAAPLTVAYLTVTRQTLRGETGAGALTAVLTAGWAVFEAAKTIDPRNTHGAIEALKAREELRELLAADDGSPRVAAADRAPSVRPKAPPLVRFEQVSFRYPGTDRAVLDSVDLEIRPGELLAVVGLNGAGKSTLIKLLCGLYDPSGGRITADGRDIAALGVREWRGQVAAVFQDFIRYQLSAADNVALDRASAPRDERALTAAARDAGLAPVVERLPDGWDTPLSRTLTGGVDLSGGQWQQVALARALYAVRTGARVLVLDEPTAHLDVRTEFDIFRKISELRGDFSTVLISHRLATVRQADRIVLLADGRVTESGSHEQLLRRGGAYADMFKIQADRFRRGYEDRFEEGDVR